MKFVSSSLVLDTVWSPLRTASSRLRFLLWRRVHTAQLAVLSQIYRGTPFLVKRQTTTCSHFISPVLAVPLGLLVKGRHSGEEWRQVSIQNISHPFPVVATCSLIRTLGRLLGDESGLLMSQGAKEKGRWVLCVTWWPPSSRCHSFNDIIMTVSQLPLALSLEVMHTTQAHTHKHT